MQLSTTELAMLREGALSSMCIGNGLTLIRKYDFTSTGYFYSGFYQVTIGVERLLKIVVIYYYKMKHGRFPTNRELKSFSHNINKLHSKIVEINNECQLSKDLPNDIIYEAIVSNLSAYGEKTRYYNLDSLSGSASTPDEPLSKWNSEVCRLILERHYKERKGETEEIKKLSGMMERDVAVIHHDDSGKEISSVYEMMMESRFVPVKQKWSIYYLLQIIRFYVRMLDCLKQQNSFFPFLHEFYASFEYEGVELTKKTWNPLPPYKF